MIGFCIEVSHSRGFGHLYKTLNFIEYLAGRDERCIVMLNDDGRAVEILEQRSIAHFIVNLEDMQSDWESALIARYGISVWLNDRLDTDMIHARNVKKNGVFLVTFDDRGSGAALADLHFAPLLFSGQEQLQGRLVITGPRYLVLNQEIEIYKRHRDNLNSILVTLGGSDTYGVTLQVVKILKTLNLTATVVVGPSFQHHEQLKQAMDESFCLKDRVPSLIKEFVQHDLAITGGGMTPFEANASGLPCIVVASELHEIEIGYYLERAGSSVFAGYYKNIDKDVFTMKLCLEKMSRAGLRLLGIDGADNIYQEIKNRAKYSRSC